MRRLWPNDLGEMAVGLEIPLANLLPMVGRLLIDPALARVGQGAAGALPVEVFALARSLGAGAVLEAGVLGDEVGGPLVGGGDEVGVPD